MNQDFSLKETRSNKIKMMGMTKSVRRVVATNPPITVIAMGALISAPSETLRAMGIIPKIVVKAVIKTGRNRTALA